MKLTFLFLYLVLYSGCAHTPNRNATADSNSDKTVYLAFENQSLHHLLDVYIQLTSATISVARAEYPLISFVSATNTPLKDAIRMIEQELLSTGICLENSSRLFIFPCPDITHAPSNIYPYTGPDILCPTNTPSYFLDKQTKFSRSIDGSTYFDNRIQKIKDDNLWQHRSFISVNAVPSSDISNMDTTAEHAPPAGRGEAPRP
jgi:hypothetical protein